MRAGYELYRQLEKVFEKAVDNTIPCVLSFGYTRYTTRRQNVEGNSKPGRVGDIPLCSGIFIFWQSFEVFHIYFMKNFVREK